MLEISEFMPIASLLWNASNHVRQDAFVARHSVDKHDWNFESGTEDCTA